MIRFISLLLYCSILFVLAPYKANASTRYYQQRSEKASVEIDLSVLGGHSQEEQTVFPEKAVEPKAEIMRSPQAVERMELDGFPEPRKALPPIRVIKKIKVIRKPRPDKPVTKNTPIVLRPTAKPVKTILYKGAMPKAKPIRASKAGASIHKTPLIKPISPVQKKTAIKQPAPITPVLSAFPDKPLLEEPKVKAILAKPIKMAPIVKQEVKQLSEPAVTFKETSKAEELPEPAVTFKEEPKIEIMTESKITQVEPVIQPTSIEDIVALPVESVEKEVVIAPKPDLSEVPSLKDLSLEFAGSSSEISLSAQKQLDQIILHLKSLDGQRLQLRAYAVGSDGNRSSARGLSLARALAVRSYLMDKGIRPTRVDVRALGAKTDRTPIDRVDIIFVQ